MLQRRPTNRVERYDNARYRRLFNTPAGPALIDVANHGTVAAPDLRWTLRDGVASPQWVTSRLRKILGLDIDPGPLARIAATEPRLKATAEALTGMRPPRFSGWFEAFANVIPFQQVSLEAGSAIVGRFIDRFGHHCDFHGQRYYAFPEPACVATADVETLRDCGLSRIKAHALVHIAQLIKDQQLKETEIAALPSTKAITRLQSLRGIGPWSATLVMLRGLGRLECFPPGDVGANRGLRELADIHSDTTVVQWAHAFGDVGGYLYFFALGRSLMDKGLIDPV